jgi:hypothetical protein
VRATTTLRIETGTAGIPAATAEKVTPKAVAVK